ncbi:MAG TPA: retropepsin-like aspartic protease [Sphingomonas sp.]|jgi:predicted aspartyl protease
MEIEWRRTGRRILIDLLILRPDPPSDLTAETVRALLDTGASACGVSRSVARRLDLPTIGKQPIVTASGLIQAERYLFRVGFSQSSLPFIFDDITGFELAGADAFDAVLGMDVLSRCDFHMLRDGTCRLRLG